MAGLAISHQNSLQPFEIYSEARKSIHFLNACILLIFHCSGVKFCMIYFYSRYINIGIKHGFPCIYVCQIPRVMLKTEAEGHGFQHLPRDLANVNAFENNV